MTAHFKNQPLKILPLGGLGEIGMNMMLIQYGNKAILIDCGVYFADQTAPGIDLIIPSLEPLERGDLQLVAIVLTHGHEDHIGALPFVLRRKSAPVYGTKFTLELVKRRLQEHQMTDAKLHLVEDGATFNVGPFDIEAIRMSHSIADAIALAIQTPVGLVIHTGDFKIDDHPADGRTTDLDRFKELGARGVLLLLSDSTNVEMEGKSKSESSIQNGITEIVKETPGWVVLSSFASHIPRMKQCLEVAHEAGRKVLPVGRTMVANLDLARELGYLRAEDHLFCDEQDLKTLKRDKVMILSTGSQGEPRSALAKMATGSMKDFQLKKGDSVILSSRLIPGNEKAIFGMINELYRQGAEVHTGKGADIHVSGHAQKEDLRTMLVAIKPQYFVPVHGEYRHLLKHCQLAMECGIPENNVALLEDGDGLLLGQNGIKRVERIALERVHIFDTELSQIADSMVQDRRKLAFSGVVSVVLVVDEENGDLLHDVEVSSSGLHFNEFVPKIHQDLSRAVESHYIKYLRKSDSEFNLQDDVAGMVKKWMKQRFDRKPIVIPQIIRL